VTTSSSDLRAHAGRLLWVGFDGLEPPPSLVKRLAAGEAGGAIVFKRNLTGDLAQARRLNEQLHAAGERVLVAVDQEGGRVQRIRATEYPPMLRLGEQAASDPEGAERRAGELGRAIGSELAGLGFDVDFAPVLDVHTNPANPIIGDRAFATTPEMVIKLAGAFARGLKAAGIIGCGKHFPGHGDTSVDSHLALPRVDHSMDRLRAVELAPFRALASELPMIMTAHVVFAALDDQVPATLSRRVLTDLLRSELAYQGVIVSDDLEMKAVADHWPIEETVVRGLEAGCDVFLICRSEELHVRAFEALVRAGERDPKIAARLAESWGRCLGINFRAEKPNVVRPES
jgi:beta-N-acetylhexosaminidase